MATLAAGDAHSPSGTFRLPPPMGTPYASPSATLKYAVFSCSNWGWGHFHAYDAAARGWGASLELDAWIHLGAAVQLEFSCIPLA